MTIFKLLSLKRDRRFPQHDKGVVSVEFAIFLPILVFLWLGVVEITSAVNVSRKSNLASRTTGDITSQYDVINASSVSSGDFYDIRTATLAVGGFSSNTATNSTFNSQIISIFIKNYSADPLAPDLRGKACWLAEMFEAGDITVVPYSPGSQPDVTVPNGYLIADTTYLQVTTNISYQPVFGASIMTQPINMRNVTYWPVRNSTGEVALNYYGSPIKCLP